MKQYGIIGLLALSFMSALPARAAEPPRIRISEINYAGSEASTADEWIEIANLENAPVDVSNWVITGIGTSGGAIALAPGTTITPQKTILIANYNVGDPKTTLTIAPQLVTTSVSIGNTDLNIILAMGDGTVTDEYHDSGKLDYGSPAPAASIERDLTDLSWHSALTSINLSKVNQMGTPGAIPVIVSNETDLTSPVPPSGGGGTSPSSTSTTTMPAEIPVTVCTCPAAEGVGIETDPYPTATTTTSVTTPILPPTPPTSPTLGVGTHGGGETPTDTAPISVPTESSGADAWVGPNNETETAGVDPSPALRAGAEAGPYPATAYAKGSLLINELLPDPLSGEEWIEILNPGLSSVDTTGWVLKDAGLHATALPEQSIAPEEFLIIEKPSGNLNNSGDSVTLQDGTGTIIDSMTYGTDALPVPKKGESAARTTDGNWQAASPTPGAINTFPQLAVTKTYDTTTDNTLADLPDPGPTEETLGPADGLPSETGEDGTYRIIAVAAPVGPTEASAPTASSATADAFVAQADIADSESLKEGVKVTVEGIVVAEPGLLGKQTAFLNGLELYFSKATWPKMQTGTTVRVTGTIGKNNGNTRLKIAKATDIKVIGEDMLVPTERDDLTDAPHGELVTLSGDVQDKSGKEWMILTDTGETITAIFAKNAKTNSDVLKKGTSLNLTGIVKRNGSTVTLVLRSPDDIEEREIVSEEASTAPAINTTAPPPDTKIPWVGGGLITTSLGALTFWYTRSKGLSLLNIISP
jgi:hypothetical protein